MVGHHSLLTVSTSHDSSNAKLNWRLTMAKYHSPMFLDFWLLSFASYICLIYHTLIRVEGYLEKINTSYNLFDVTLHYEIDMFNHEVGNLWYGVAGHTSMSSAHFWQTYFPNSVWEHHFYFEMTGYRKPPQWIHTFFLDRKTKTTTYPGHHQYHKIIHVHTNNFNF